MKGSIGFFFVCGRGGDDMLACKLIRLLRLFFFQKVLLYYYYYYFCAYVHCVDQRYYIVCQLSSGNTDPAFPKQDRQRTFGMSCVDHSMM